MRCASKEKVWFKEYIWWIDYDDTGILRRQRIQRSTYIWQQCQTTTRSKNALCWKEWGLCGMHAAQEHPEYYPKAKGHLTGGRHGKGLNQSFLFNEPIMVPRT